VVSILLVPSPRHDDRDRNPGLTEIYLRVEIPTMLVLVALSRWGRSWARWSAACSRITSVSTHAHAQKHTHRERERDTETHAQRERERERERERALVHPRRTEKGGGEIEGT
jgi:hypothetical protein